MLEIAVRWNRIGAGICDCDLLVCFFIDHAAAAIRLGGRKGDCKFSVHTAVLTENSAGLKRCDRAAALIIQTQNGHTMAVFKCGIHPKTDGQLLCTVDLRAQPCRICVR